MSSKNKKIFVCSDCGHQHIKWQGVCLSCGAGGTIIEDVLIEQKNNRFSHVAKSDASPQFLSEVKRDGNKKRISSGFAELDRVLGGGFVNGSVSLLGGDPGIGKSTILMQSVSNISFNYNVLYISGEESAEQIALRAERLNLNLAKIKAISEICLEKIINIIETEKPAICVVDSIQTIYSDNIQSAPGATSQVRECSAVLTRLAKNTNTTIIIVGHVTKDGNIAGPRVLEHIVDTVLYFEGDQNLNHRIIRSFKNRFGPVNEIGVFSMGEDGLTEVTNPSSAFIDVHQGSVVGSSVLVTKDGTRSILLEVQALIDNTDVENPRKISVGLDNNRLIMLVAIMAKYCNIFCYNKNIFINVVGGVKITDTGADLASMLALVSSYTNKPLPEKTIAFGEIGLTGEIKPVQSAEDRVKEAAKIGYVNAIIPSKNLIKSIPGGMNIIYVSNVLDAIKALTKI